MFSYMSAYWTDQKSLLASKDRLDKSVEYQGFHENELEPEEIKYRCRRMT